VDRSGEYCRQNIDPKFPYAVDGITLQSPTTLPNVGLYVIFKLRCHLSYLDVEWSFRFNQFLILMLSVLGALTIRLLSKSWTIALLGAVLLLGRGTFLARTGLASGAMYGATVVNLSILCLIWYVRTASPWILTAAVSAASVALSFVPWLAPSLFFLFLSIRWWTPKLAGWNAEILFSPLLEQSERISWRSVSYVLSALVVVCVIVTVLALRWQPQLPDLNFQSPLLLIKNAGGLIVSSTIADTHYRLSAVAFLIWTLKSRGQLIQYPMLFLSTFLALVILNGAVVDSVVKSSSYWPSQVTYLGHSFFICEPLIICGGAGVFSTLFAQMFPRETFRDLFFR
jgi:hypothetical protein